MRPASSSADFAPPNFLRRSRSDSQLLITPATVQARSHSLSRTHRKPGWSVIGNDLDESLIAFQSSSRAAWAVLLSFFVARSKARSKERADWMRGMSEERRVDSISDVHPLELVIIFAVFVDVIVFLVWFFAFANPGTPVGQG